MGLENVRASSFLDRAAAQRFSYNLPMARRAEFWGKPVEKAKKKKQRPQIAGDAPPVAASPSAPLQPQPPPQPAPAASPVEPSLLEWWPADFGLPEEARTDPSPTPAATITQGPLVANRAAMLDHLDWLFAHLRGGEFGDGLVEIAYDGDDRRPSKARLFGLNDLEAAASFAARENGQGSNLYVGVALKKPETPRAERTFASDFYVGGAIPCDIDEDADATNAKLDAIATAGVVVTTGTIPELRQQKWYRLKEPCKDAALFANAFERLVKHVGGDKSALGAGRIMRLAGSVSYPKTEKMARGYVRELTRLIIDPDAAPVEIERFAELPISAAPSGAKAPFEPRRAPKMGGDFFTNVNDAALADLGAWVPEIFGDDAKPQRTGGWRVSSKALERDLEEDLSLHPDGIKDFGVHDMGDPREGKRSPIDIVIEHQKNSVAERCGALALPAIADRPTLSRLARPDRRRVQTRGGPASGRDFRPMAEISPP